MRLLGHFLFFFYEKISHAPKAPKAQKALKGTNTLWKSTKRKQANK